MNEKEAEHSKVTSVDSLPPVEGKHPFQEFLYELRDGGIHVATSEWLDFQSSLELGEVSDPDDLFVIGRSLLVKNVDMYSKYEEIFRRVFFKNREVNNSQEIVDPGTTEEHHGGDDVHKVIEDSKSSGHEGGGGKSTSGKHPLSRNWGSSSFLGGGQSELQKFDKDTIVRIGDYEMFQVALASLMEIVQEEATMSAPIFNAKATVQATARNGGTPEFIWNEELENKPKVLMLIDISGSNALYVPVMEKLFAAAKDVFEHVEVYYFYNTIYDVVWSEKDSEGSEKSIEDILKVDRSTKLILMGDASIAHEWLFDEFDKERGLRSYDQLCKLRDGFDHSVWLNPVPPAEWGTDDNATIVEFKEIFTMFPLSVNGVKQGVNHLMAE